MLAGDQGGTLLRFIEITVGEGGEVACARCAQRRLPRYRGSDEIAEDVRDAVDEFGDGPGPNVSLVGSEPLGHPELPALVTACVRSGVERLRLEGDAGGFAAGENAAGALASGIRHFRMRLLAGTPALHDGLLGAPGRLEASLDGMAAFVAAAESGGHKVAPSALVPLCRHNLAELPQAVTLACSAGARAVTIRLADPTMGLAAAVPLLDAACDSGTVNSAWVSLEGFPREVTAGLELHAAWMEGASRHGPDGGQER